MKGQVAPDRAPMLAFLPDLLEKDKSYFTPLRPAGRRSVKCRGFASVPRPSPSVLLLIFARRWGDRLCLKINSSWPHGRGIIYFQTTVKTISFLVLTLKSINTAKL